MWSLDLNLIYTLPFFDINWQDWGCWGLESGKFGLYFAFISETAKEKLRQITLVPSIVQQNVTSSNILPTLWAL